MVFFINVVILVFLIDIFLEMWLSDHLENTTVLF